MLSIICVIGKNREIGFQNKLLWDIPEDMKHFKDVTFGCTVIMGDKTFESIGKALPGRKNIIVTRDENYKAEGCEVSNSLEDTLTWAKEQDKEIFVIGGGQIYKQSLPWADKLYLTLVEDAPEADTFFPDFSGFKEIKSSEQKEHNKIKFRFVEYEK
ncbi:dihydrofolate reductase [Candidatus Falkowbacteria bacterium]|jgi:dihydrofolate reductase|nr:dihydrofolate reductase [Candidatus Falkowbacteria bacterium]MBT4432758.1 dihydrofolate reductase [Candidatus Falkowbacteria bacterium]